MESSNNSSVQPLISGRSFIGKADDVLQYNLTQFQLTTTTSCLVKIFQSNDRITYTSTSVQYNTPNQTMVYSLPLSCRFVTYNVQNTSMFNQTSLNLSVLYRSSLPVGKTSQIIWSNEASGVGGFSDIIDNSKTNAKSFSFMGNVSTGTTLTVQTSVDGITFFSTQTSYTVTSASDVGWTCDLPANYIRIISSANAVILLYASSV